MRERLPGPDLGTDLPGLDVAARGDEVGHDGRLGLVLLRHGDEQQVLAGGGEGGLADLDLLAQVEGERGTRGVGLLLGPVLFALGLAPGLPLADHVEQPGLLLFEVAPLVLFFLFRRVLLQPDVGRLRQEARGDVIDEPGVFLAEGDAVVARHEERIGLLRGGAGDLAAGPGLEVLQKDVALAGPGLPAVVAAEIAARGVDCAELRGGHDLRLAGRKVEPVEVALLRALPLALVVDGASIVGPVGALRRSPHPVRVGHDLLQRDPAALGGSRERRGKGGEQRQQDDGGEGASLANSGHTGSFLTVMGPAAWISGVTCERAGTATDSVRGR
ncbi:MAG TPA: hypothetical protein VMW27_07675 [Thermoanaerobaculia bacterium]|nr:hypothetical protein [Thermoanaerobaculia bacterium]